MRVAEKLDWKGLIVLYTDIGYSKERIRDDQHKQNHYSHNDIAQNDVV
jgi:hypothetical protein